MRIGCNIESRHFIPPQSEKSLLVAQTINWRLPQMGEACRQKGILYAPDFVINAGGIIRFATNT